MNRSSFIIAQQQQQQRLFKHDKNYRRADVVVYLKFNTVYKWIKSLKTN